VKNELSSLARNSAVAATSLSREYQIAHDLMGMNVDELRLVNQTAYEARFDS